MAVKPIFLLALASAQMFAQLAQPNEAGVSMGHIHLMSKDVAAQTEFWTSMMGGTAIKNGPLSLIQFPGVFIMVRQGEPSASPAGSIVNHFGFVAKDLPGLRAKWQTAGLKFDQSENPNSGYINGPDGIRVEIFGDPKLTVPMQMNHIHMFTPDIPAMKAWYVKTFGAIPGQRAACQLPLARSPAYFLNAITGAEVPTFPAASQALAVNVCEPLESLWLFKVKL